MVGRPQRYDNMPAAMDFREAKANFVKAARYGRDAIMQWDGYDYSVKKLIKKVLKLLIKNMTMKILHCAALPALARSTLALWFAKV